MLDVSGPTDSSAMLSSNKEQMDFEDLYQGEQQPKKSIRKTGIRWLMLTFGCLFLMGSYFCFDNPTPIQSILEESPYNLTVSQFEMLFEVYSLPNWILPLLGGTFLDKVGVRPGLLMFTVLLTIGQFVFALGGQKNLFWLMLVGRFIFGLGGECMTVAQSVIIANWFKGKEFSFAMGLSLSVSRLGSVLNGILLPRICAHQLNSEGEETIGLALFVGFFICLFSLLNACFLVSIDYYADKSEGVLNVPIPDDEKFHFSDICAFKLPYWLLTGSCVAVYMCVLNYLQVTPNILQYQYGFTSVTAGTIYGIPYEMSLIMSPFLGLLIDRKGLRSVMILTSSVMCFVACIWNAAMPVFDEPSWWCLPSLLILGLGYSIYGAALWSCVPYTVPAKTIGSAYGLTTSIQNTGMFFGPLIIGAIQDSRKDQYNYTYSMIFLAFCAFLGFLVNLWLFFDDLWYRDGILYKVDKSMTIDALTMSPAPGPRKVFDADDSVAQGELVANEDEMMANALDQPNEQQQQMQLYKEDRAMRQQLKSSLAKPRQ